MIIVKIRGGLGNQLFQYAFAKALALKHQTQLILDISYYSTNTKVTARTFKLLNYQIIEDIASINEIETLINTKPALFNKICKKIAPQYCSYYKENNKSFDPKAFKLGKNVYIDGYWQNQLYFHSIKDLIRNTFIPKISLNTKLIDLIHSTNSVSIHYRRTDYCSLGLDISNNIEFYLNAIDIISNKFKNPVLLIFSDDIEWAKSNIKYNHETHFIESSDIEELYLMSLCKHNIIANSTFSWWAAWLNNNVDKIVIAPKTWHNPDAESTIYPSSWIVI